MRAYVRIYVKCEESDKNKKIWLTRLFDENEVQYATAVWKKEEREKKERMKCLAVEESDVELSVTKTLW